MKNHDTGGPAFPFVFDDMATHTRQVYTGMTLRDYFAAKAMQGMLACDIEFGPEQVPIIAASAYVMADAMLKARQA